MRMIHKKLYQQKGFLKVDFPQFLHRLLQYLLLSDLQETRSLEFESDIFNNIDLNVNQAIHFSLLFSEFFQNIYEHANPEVDLSCACLNLL